jgi:hypothetical protein
MIPIDQGRMFFQKFLHKGGKAGKACVAEYSTQAGSPIRRDFGGGSFMVSGTN